MDQQQWAVLQPVFRRITRSFGRLPRATYSDLLIVRLYFWAVLHERPMTWAIEPVHYNRTFRPRQLPSISQLNRRVASDRFQRLLQSLHDHLSDRESQGTHCLCVDGKPLCVSPVSRDRDARSGHTPGGMAKGYKLHAIVTATRQIPVFCVLPLNRHEMPVARAMLEQLPSLHGSLVVADGNYDSHILHQDIAARGGWLLTRPRGRARHPVTRRQMGAARRALIDLWDGCPELMQRVYRQRNRVEQVFGHLTCTPGLLGPLPAFVRGLHRVRRWVGAKICLYHARCIARANAKMLR
jgi:DDE family transposase